MRGADITHQEELFSDRTFAETPGGGRHAADHLGCGIRRALPPYRPGFDSAGAPITRQPAASLVFDTHASTTGPDARLYKKSEGDKSQLCFMGHVLMENRNGLVIDVEVTHAIGTAERDAAKAMIKRRITQPGATLGADKGYDMKDFVAALRQRKATPHVAQKAKGSAIDRHITRHAG